MRSENQPPRSLRRRGRRSRADVDPAFLVALPQDLDPEGFQVEGVEGRGGLPLRRTRSQRRCEDGVVPEVFEKRAAVGALLHHETDFGQVHDRDDALADLRRAHGRHRRLGDDARLLGVLPAHLGEVRRELPERSVPVGGVDAEWLSMTVERKPWMWVARISSAWVGRLFSPRKAITWWAASM